jgi:hypothetical protein
MKDERLNVSFSVFFPAFSYVAITAAVVYFSLLNLVGLFQIEKLNYLF